MPYLLDANVFIEAKQRYYGLDFCPAFWDWLVAANASGRVFSIAKVGDELAAGEDELSAWAAKRGARFFLPIAPETVPAMRQVSAWVSGQPYTPSAKTTFLEKADFYLIAQAAVLGYTVVTHEKPEDTPKKVKIPNVCVGVGVRVASTFEMLRAERARFTLRRPDGTASA